MDKENVKLNLGCDAYKLPDFLNIDINSQVTPDMCMDVSKLDETFQDNTVDFIYAGHILEHFDSDESYSVMKQCLKILKPFRSLIAVVPDYQKAVKYDLGVAEVVLLGKGAHKILFDGERLVQMLKLAGFRSVFEIPLTEVPFLLVPDVNNPVPEGWQTAVMALKN